MLLTRGRYLTADQDDDAEFANSILQQQGLLRWEFRPQFVLYVSYTRRGLGAASANYTLRHVYGITDANAEQRFMVKASYMF